MNIIKRYGLLIGSAVAGIGASLVNIAHGQVDYLVTASDTVPIFENTAAVGKQQFVQTANIALPYYVGFMIALVVLLLALLPVKKIWGVIAGHFS